MPARVWTLGVNDLGEGGGDVIEIVLVHDLRVLRGLKGKDCKLQVIGSKSVPKCGIPRNLLEYHPPAASRKLPGHISDTGLTVRCRSDARDSVLRVAGHMNKK